jgi:inner membrane protein
MDNLTHSLVGALIGQMGLKRKTGMAMPTLIIAANIPDIDAVAVLLGGHQHLAIRRGITHGPIAMLVLPLLLWGIMLWFDRWQTRREKRPGKRLPIHKGWLLALAYIGCLSHPLFDWFNSYGIRLLEPFSSQWFYGDALFIIDPWLLVIMAASIWISLKQQRKGSPRWEYPARVGFCGICTYIAFNLTISGLASARYDGPDVIVANPVSLAFWQRENLWRDKGLMRIMPPPENYGREAYSLLSAKTPMSTEKLGPTNMSDPRIALWAEHNPDAKAFLFWSRMPVAELHEDRIILRDQRFMDPLVMDRFTVTLRPPQ